MADRSLVRPGSRGFVSSSIAEPRRSARATRSQSREIGASDVDSRIPSAVPPLNGNKSRKNDPAPPPELPTVDEDARETDERLLEGEDNNSESENKSSRRISAFSGTTARMSGVGPDGPGTPSVNLILEALPDIWKSSGKLLQILLPDECSAEAIARIRDLVQDALQSQKTKQPPRQRESSRFLANLARERRALELQLEYCPDEPKTGFISIEKALAAMHSPENDSILGSGDRRPSALVITANLARLAHKTISCSSLDNGRFLEEVDASFPQAFTSMSLENQIQDIGQDVHSTLQLAVGLRIQHAIAQFGKYMMQPNFDRNRWLHEIFFTDNDALRGWSYGNLRSHDLSRSAKKFIHVRMAEITKIIEDTSNGNNNTTTLNHLRENFDWENSAHMTMRWIHRQFVDIESTVESSGGVDELVQTIQERIWSGSPGTIAGANAQDRGIEQRRRDETSSAPQKSTSRRGLEAEDKVGTVQAEAEELRLSRFDPSSAKSLQGAKIFKKRKAQKANMSTSNAVDRGDTSAPKPQISALPSLPARSRSPDSADKLHNQLHLPSNQIRRKGSRPPLAQNEQIDDDWQPIQDDDDVQELGRSSDQADTPDRILDERDRDLAEQTKDSRNQNLYPTLPSEPTRRMIDHQPDAHVEVWNGDLSESDDPPSQMSQMSKDMGFQQSQHSNTQEALQQHRKRPPIRPPESHQSPPKRRRVQESKTSREREVTSSNPLSRASQAAPSSSRSAVQFATQVAKDVVAIQGSKPLQSRVGWSAEETECLLRLISEHGCSWSLIQRMDTKKILHRRDQVGLKDKARNLKMIFLKAGNQKLPDNFHRIAITQDQINKLDELGIKYDKETGLRTDAEID